MEDLKEEEKKIEGGKEEEEERQKGLLHSPTSKEVMGDPPLSRVKVRDLLIFIEGIWNEMAMMRSKGEWWPEEDKGGLVVWLVNATPAFFPFISLSLPIYFPLSLPLPSLSLSHSLSP